VAFGERLETLQWVGVACVLAGLLFNQLGGRWLRTR
jgi:O-acetylserine/cysteine efflux transporter